MSGIPKTTTKPKNISLKKNSTRAILGSTVWVISLLHITSESVSLLDNVFSFLLFLYVSSSAAWFLLEKRRNRKYKYYMQMSTVDIVVYSSALANYSASFTVSAAIFCIIILHAMLIGGARQAINDTGAFFIGASAVTLMTNPDWHFGIKALEALILYSGIAAYLLVYATHIQTRIKGLNANNQKLHNDVVLHKLRSYKLSRYVSPTVWKALNQGRDSTLKTERKRVSVFFSDIAGFSSLSEELEAEALTELLNTYLTEMVKIAAAHRGTIDKFMGDGLMVIFGDINSDGMKADCLRCVAMAVDMRKKMKELETKWFNQGIKKPLKIRMGINSGYCTVGTFGTSEYMDYTVLGTHVNLASRLESAADSGEILISHETWSLIKDVVMCRDRGEIKAKGFSHPIKVYQVVDFRKDMGKNQSYFEEHSHGFSIHLDLDKIKNYDKSRIIDHLESLADKVKDKI